MKQTPENKLTWKRILFFGPWILFFPMILVLEIHKLDLGHTRKLSGEERRRHFLKVAMPELDDTYFNFLGEVHRNLEPLDQGYTITWPVSLSIGSQRLMEGFAIYDLTPHRPRDSRKGTVPVFVYPDPTPLQGGARKS